MSTHVLTNGFYFDLAVIALALMIAGAYFGWRWLTFGRYERRHRRQIEQHLAEAQRPSFPQGTHEGDWDWPRALETDRRLRRP